MSGDDDSFGSFYGIYYGAHDKWEFAGCKLNDDLIHGFFMNYE